MDWVENLYAIANPLLFVARMNDKTVCRVSLDAEQFRTLGMHAATEGSCLKQGNW